jgi:hypothetical protein
MATNQQVRSLIRQRLNVEVEALLAELPADVRARIPAELIERRLLERVERTVLEALGIDAGHAETDATDTPKLTPPCAPEGPSL